MRAKAALAQVLRQDRGRLLAALVARTRDLQRAEDALQEAAASALVHWERAGLPASPQGWLLRAALRKAIDGYRRDASLSRHREAMAALAGDEAAEPDAQAIPDERLRLIFTCCHPALEQKTRVALTLRSLCGLTTAEVAAAFLDSETAMGQRLSRARAKIAGAGIAFRVPGPEDFPDRLNSVLTTVYLIFTTGYVAGPEAGADLCEEAIFLARLLVALVPDAPEVEGALALLLLTHARAAARVAPDGAALPPAAQDRALWDMTMLREGERLLETALNRRSAGPFQIKAAIAALQSATPIDWPQIVLLYARLHAFEPTAVVRLNQAVAVAEAGHLEAALAGIEALGSELDAYQPFHAARAHILARCGRTDAARSAYGRAIALAVTDADRAFLAARLAALE